MVVKIELLKQHSEILLARKRRLEGDDFPTPLKDLCVTSIRENWQYFLELEECTGSNPFDQISSPMKAQLLGESTIKKWDKWEQLLVNKSVTKLSLSLDDSESVNKFCSTPESKQPLLVYLSWTGSPDLPAFETIISSLNLTNLQTLELHATHVNDQDLISIANQLQNLRILKVGEVNVTADGISILASLEFLEEFRFKAPRNSISTLFNVCLQLLPKLLVIKDYEEIPSNISAYYWGRIRDFFVDFERLPTPTELGLKQLVLHNRVGMIPEGVTMPNLTSLLLWNPLVDFQPDAQPHHFSKVTELHFIELDTNVILKVLSFFGQQIRKLFVHDEGDEDEIIEVDLILRLCPNLVHFGIFYGKAEMMKFTSPLEPNADLKYLEILDLGMPIYSRLYDLEFFSEEEVREFRYGLTSPGLLLQFLSAPNLRELTMNGIDLNKEESNLIVSLLKEGEILQNLSKFDFSRFMASEADAVDPRHRDEYNDLVDSMVKYCPKLVHVEETEV